MFQDVVTFIAARFFYTGNLRNISFLSLVCVLGTGLSISILICILSIMNGFEEEVKSRSFGADGHILINLSDKTDSSITSLKKELSNDDDLLYQFEFTENEAIVSNEGSNNPVRIRGLRSDNPNLINRLNSFSQLQNFDGLHERRFKSIVGLDLMENLGLKIGDSFRLFSPQIQYSPLGYFFRSRSFEIVDVVEFRYKTLDSSVIFLSEQDSNSIFGAVNIDKTLRLYYKAGTDIPKKTEELKSKNLEIKTWKDENTALYQALILEKFVMFITLLLAIIIAVLNVTSVLTIGIISQRSTINTLYSIGMEKKRIRKIFIAYGSMVGILGWLLGLVLGVTLSLTISKLVAFFELIFDFSVFPADLYYISKVPASFELGDLILVAIASSLMLAASVIVSSSLSKTIGLRRVSRNR